MPASTKRGPLLCNLFFCLNRFPSSRSCNLSALHTTAVQYFLFCPCYCSVYVHKPHPGFVCSCCIVVEVKDFFCGRPLGLVMEGELIQQTLLNKCCWARLDKCPEYLFLNCILALRQRYTQFGNVAALSFVLFRKHI